MRLALPAILLLALACGRPEAPSTASQAPPQAAKKPPVAPPTPAQARAVLADSGELGEYQFTNAAVTLPLKRTAMNPVALANAKQLVAAGWLRFNGDDLEVAEKAKDDSRFLVRGNGFMDVVPVAKKVLGDVSAVRPGPEGMDVDFTWQWTPTEVGKAFTKGPVAEQFGKDRKATATLISDGTKWSVLRIVEGK